MVFFIVIQTIPVLTFFMFCHFAFCCFDLFPAYMKDEIDITKCTILEENKEIINDWIGYYNNEGYQ